MKLASSKIKSQRQGGEAKAAIKAYKRGRSPKHGTGMRVNVKK
jgi:hypothetical protein